MPTPIAEFQGVTKIYRAGWLRQRPIFALREVSLTIPRGCVFGVLGPNRAGKTTLVKILLSICRPSGGTILRLGRPLADHSTLARVGYLHESQAFPRYLTAENLLRYYGSLSLVSARDLHQRIPPLLEQVGLGDRAYEPIGTFSKGMLQRLALAQALVNEPELLVLDEPSEGMDLLARRLLHEVIRRRREQGKTAILVSHSMPDVQRLCDLVAVLRQGTLAFAGPLAELTDGRDADEAATSADPLQNALEAMYAGAAP